MRQPNKHGSGGEGHPLLATVLVVLLVVGLGVAWFQARSRVDRQGDQAAGKCVEGPATIPIIASPDIAEVLGEIAKRYNATRPVVRDHCVTVSVRPSDSKVVLEGLRGTWDTESMGPHPVAWIPQSSLWAAELTTGKPNAVEGSPDSLASSPVVLAMRSEFADNAAGKLAWSDLPGLAKRPNAMADFGLPTWGPLRLAMPVGVAADATVLSAQAIAAGVSRTSGPLTAAQAESRPVADGIKAVLDAAPTTPEGAAAPAAVAISRADPRRGMHAVPITEQQLYLLARTGAVDTSMRAFFPSGATPVADYPVLRLADDKVSAAQSDGVVDFVDFVKMPAQAALLTGLGFRTERAQPSMGNSAVSFPAVRDPLARPEAAASAAITKLVFR
ncbi:substrate-binding domain-containing protein [Gordonia crocea]|uniref:Extracellular solute-binding protein n=1 Tax=Gordonia crocea TaxID=589162 RepID=A0A7I9UYP6_9ACTN|nr:substrate-binding domain-containing protein [Gordonia crocea]GED98052.1 hypothetical protein nbrc107697_20910 [Gordonia crocea]